MNWSIRRILDFLIVFGRVGESIARHAGGIGLLVWRSAVSTFAGRVGFRDVIAQTYSIGVQSLPLVVITAVLTGVISSQQGGYQVSGAVPLYIVGSVVTSTIILELGPALTAIVLIGRVGARITAELGTMQVSEQIDALHSLGRDPVAVLGAPRIIAGILTMPFLVGTADGVGFLSGMISARATMGLGIDSFLYGARMFWHNWDLFYSLFKALAFGFIIPVISVHMGFLTRGGAEGVGRSTTASVVFMIIAIWVTDAMFPPLLLN
ncbi:MAG: ABC transporter permease [Vicinamibacteria bacterium]|nr:ABC transporter permease [Vicinamibacteria bacterium]